MNFEQLLPPTEITLNLKKENEITRLLSFLHLQIDIVYNGYVKPYINNLKKKYSDFLDKLNSNEIIPFISRIYENISDKFKEKLLCYFSDSGLEDYILYKITEYIMDDNELTEEEDES